jgi:hypothetical protein
MSANMTGGQGRINFFRRGKEQNDGSLDKSHQSFEMSENNGSVLLIQNNTNYFIG